MPEIYIDGRSLRVDTQQAIGKGYEADIYDIGGGQALKLFKDPNHPDIAHDQFEQMAAQRRLDLHQKKLPAYPSNLPPQVVTPLKLATDRSGRIVGYTMTKIDGATVLKKYGEQSFRDRLGIGGTTAVEVLKSLHDSVTKLHNAGVVIGDFNDLNVLVNPPLAYMIDADSFAFGSFPCMAFMVKFVDPRLCDFGGGLKLTAPHDVDSDWYAYAVMVMQTLVYTGPHGGVYRPGGKGAKMNLEDRLADEATVWHKDVQYPKSALPLEALSADLLDFLHSTFVGHQRGAFPLDLLTKLGWTRCSSCGLEHARRRCPVCHKAPPAPPPAVVVRGGVSVREVFKTNGAIVFADTPHGQPVWVTRVGDQLLDESNRPVINIPAGKSFKLARTDKQTLIGSGHRLVVIEDGTTSIKQMDTVEEEPVFAATPKGLYWANNGSIWKQGSFGDKHLGDVLRNQTRFWVGPRFGVGFYRAGNLNQAFVFDAEHGGINDTVKLSPMSGQLIDAACYFGSNLAWLFRVSREGPQVVVRCEVLTKYGEVLAETEEVASEQSWMANIHGLAATGSMLFAPTTDGIVRVEADENGIAVVKRFPDTRTLVSPSDQLLVGKEGLYAVSRNRIRLITIN